MRISRGANETSTLFASASLVMMTLTAVFAFIGYVQAGQDEVEFRKAMICAVANGVLVIVGMFFQISNSIALPKNTLKTC